jgi:hypothetical protein
LTLALSGCRPAPTDEGDITSSQSQAIWSAAYTVVVAAQDELLPELQKRDVGAGKGDLFGDGGAGTDGGTDKLADGGADKIDGGSGGWTTGVDRGLFRQRRPSNHAWTC